VDDQLPSPSPHAITQKNSRSKRILLWIAGIFLFLLVCGFIAVEVALHRAEPILRARVIETLSTRFDSRVELEHFHVYFLHGFEVTGSGLKLYPNQIEPDQMRDKPLFAVDEFSFRTTWHGLLHTPMYVDKVNLKGMQIHMPPKEQRQNMPKLNTNNGGGGKIEILVGEIEIENAALVLETSKPGKIPMDFEISHLTL